MAQITVKGNIGKDPELKFSANKTAWISFSIGYTPREKKDGEWTEGETMWFRVVSFGDKAEALADTLAKGDSVIVSGTLKQSTYKGRDGAEQTSLEITASEIGVVPRINKRKADKPSW